ncbi:hypothetical protein [Synechococcus sp. MIT S1220]|uniref:hypothetical protein n=1 Tax=Synechococcus sp. MIT S1220 TaxID=3082549 RepID=UPI0039B12580
MPLAAKTTRRLQPDSKRSDHRINRSILITKAKESFSALLPALGFGRRIPCIAFRFAPAGRLQNVSGLITVQMYYIRHDGSWPADQPTAPATEAIASGAAIGW